MEAELREQALRLGLDNVVFAGFVSDREKMALFQLCRAVALGIPTATSPLISVGYLLAWFMIGGIVATRFLRSRMVS